MFKNLVLGFSLALAVATGAHANVTPAFQFWLGGIDPGVQASGGMSAPPDYMTLFTSPTPWPQSEPRTNAFKVSAQFALAATDAQIQTVFNTMHAAAIRVGMEMGSIVRLDACGGGEGYAPSGIADKIGSRLKSLGVTLDYIEMDEPVWFGREMTGPAPILPAQPYCQYPIATLADRAALTITTMQKYMPDVQVGMIDVISAAEIPIATLAQDDADFITALTARMRAYQPGFAVQYFHADTNWSNPAWLSLMETTAAAINGVGVPFGVVIGGSPTDTTNAAWASDALSRLSMILHDPKITLSAVVAQSWQKLPTNMLPEAAPGTQTNILLQAQQMVAKAPLAAGFR